MCPFFVVSDVGRIVAFYQEKLGFETRYKESEGGKMSRGPGTWQRGILAALEQHPAVYLMDLLPRPRTRSQVVALNRAARLLQQAGKIRMVRWSVTVPGDGRCFVAVARPGYEVHYRDDVPRIRVAPVPEPN
jgi:hypothetical protein